MASASLILGIVLMILVLRIPPGKPLMGTGLKIVVGFLLAFFLVFIIWLGLHSPDNAEEVVGKSFGNLFIIGIFVGIGEAIRKKRVKKESEKAKD
jgi:hypothetical protein